MLQRNRKKMYEKENEKSMSSSLFWFRIWGSLHILQKHDYGVPWDPGRTPLERWTRITNYFVIFLDLPTYNLVNLLRTYNHWHFFFKMGCLVPEFYRHDNHQTRNYRLKSRNESKAINVCALCVNRSRPHLVWWFDEWVIQLLVVFFSFKAKIILKVNEPIN